MLPSTAQGRQPLVGPEGSGGASSDPSWVGADSSAPSFASSFAPSSGSPGSTSALPPSSSLLQGNPGPRAATLPQHPPLDMPPQAGGARAAGLPSPAPNTVRPPGQCAVGGGYGLAGLARGDAAPLPSSGSPADQFPLTSPPRPSVRSPLQQTGGSATPFGAAARPAPGASHLPTPSAPSAQNLSPSSSSSLVAASPQPSGAPPADRRPSPPPPSLVPAPSPSASGGSGSALFGRASPPAVSAAGPPPPLASLSALRGAGSFNPSLFASPSGALPSATRGALASSPGQPAAADAPSSTAGGLPQEGGGRPPVSLLNVFGPGSAVSASLAAASLSGFSGAPLAGLPAPQLASLANALHPGGGGAARASTAALARPLAPHAAAAGEGLAASAFLSVAAGSAAASVDPTTGGGAPAGKASKPAPPALSAPSVSAARPSGSTASARVGGLAQRGSAGGAEGKRLPSVSAASPSSRAATGASPLHGGAGFAKKSDGRPRLSPEAAPVSGDASVADASHRSLAHLAQLPFAGLKDETPLSSADTLLAQELASLRASSPLQQLNDSALAAAQGPGSGSVPAVEGRFYSSFCRLLYELSLRQVSLVDKRGSAVRATRAAGPRVRPPAVAEALGRNAAAATPTPAQPRILRRLCLPRRRPRLPGVARGIWAAEPREQRGDRRGGGAGGAAAGVQKGAGAGAAAGPKAARAQALQKRRERSIFVELKQTADAVERDETARRLRRRVESLDKRLAQVKTIAASEGRRQARADGGGAIEEAQPSAEEGGGVEGELKEEVRAETGETGDQACEENRGEAGEGDAPEKKEDGEGGPRGDSRSAELFAVQVKKEEKPAQSALHQAENQEDVKMEASADEHVDVSAEKNHAVVPGGAARVASHTVFSSEGEDGADEVYTVYTVEDEGAVSLDDPTACDSFVEESLGPTAAACIEGLREEPGASGAESRSLTWALATSLADSLRRACLHTRLVPLLPLQTSLRQEVCLQRLLEEAPEALPPLLHVSVRTARKHRLLREQRENAEAYLETKGRQTQRRQVFLSALLEVHRRNFINTHRESLKQIRRVAAAVKRRRACFLGENEDEGTADSATTVSPERLGDDGRGRHCGHHLHPTKCGCPAAAADLAAVKRRERLDALKKHDEAAYLALLQETKNERLLQLVRQTEEYMRKMGDLIIEQREREGEIELDPLDLPSAEEPGSASASAAEGAKGEEAETKETGGPEGKAEGEGGEKDGGDATEEEKKNKESLSSFLLSKERYYRLTHAKRVRVTELPRCLKGGSLRSYQMEGLNWMASLYNNGLNGILADSMGLGKTVQTVSFLAYLHEVKRVRNPFLIVAPLSTIHGNWRSELKKWWPSINLVVYEGTKEYRKQLRSRIVGGLHSRGPGSGSGAATALGPDGVAAAAAGAEGDRARAPDGGKDGANKLGAKGFVEPYFHALLTTDAVILRDKSFLRKIKWEYLVVDEAHRLKNPNSKLVQTLNTGFHIRRRLALTGTPLQNDIVEVWALLNFLMPAIFNAKLNFEQWLNVPLAAPPTLFGGSHAQQDEHLLNVTEEEKLLIVDRLHKVLRPFLLRREKAEVANELPSKQEEIVWCPLSGVQRYLYKMIEGNPVGQNRMVQLRKICNHPYLFCYSNYTPDESMVRCCGKFAMLDVLLPALKLGNHRVLIFSQMTKLLDILEVYLSMRGHKYLRLDGGTSSEERQKRLTLYNQEGSEFFIFILSTKAGGLGVNLQSADTVIIFDSDWNPQNDEQAQSRAHRIGQKKEVLTLRFISVESIEEQILQRAECKLDKDKLVIQSGMYYGHGQEEVHDPSRDLERTNQVREILRKQRQLDVNLTRALDLQLLKRQIARTPEDMLVFEKADRFRKLLHVPGLISNETLPPCLFSWSRAAERAQEALVSAHQKKQAEDAWKSVYARSDFWTMREEKAQASAESPADATLAAIGAGDSDSAAENAASDAQKKDPALAATAAAPEAPTDAAEAAELEGRVEKKQEASAPSSVEGTPAPLKAEEGEEGKSIDETADLPGNTTANEEATAASALAARGVDLALWREKINSCIREALNAAIACRDFDVFVELPSKELYKDYFERIKKPICLLDIRLSADKQEFTCLPKLEKYLTRLAENARSYNGAESPIFLRAVECMGFVMRESRRRLCVAFYSLIDAEEAGKVLRLLDSVFAVDSSAAAADGVDSALLAGMSGKHGEGYEEEEDEASSVVSGSRVSLNSGSSRIRLFTRAPPGAAPCARPPFPPAGGAFPAGADGVANRLGAAAGNAAAFPSVFPSRPFPAAASPFPQSASLSSSEFSPAFPGKAEKAGRSLQPHTPAYLEVVPTSVNEAPFPSSFPSSQPSGGGRPLLQVNPVRISLSSASRGGGPKGLLDSPGGAEGSLGTHGETGAPVAQAAATRGFASRFPASSPAGSAEGGAAAGEQDERRARGSAAAKRGRKRGRPSRKDLESAALQAAARHAAPLPNGEAGFGVANPSAFPSYTPVPAFPSAAPVPFRASPGFPTVGGASPPTAVGGDVPVGPAGGPEADDHEDSERGRKEKKKKKKDKKERGDDDESAGGGGETKRRKKDRDPRSERLEEELDRPGSLPSPGEFPGRVFPPRAAPGEHLPSSFPAPADAAATGAKKFRIRLLPGPPSFPSSSASLPSSSFPSPGTSGSFPSAAAPRAYPPPASPPPAANAFPASAPQRPADAGGHGINSAAPAPKFRIRIAPHPPQPQ
ncbi:putative SWI2/SNF2 Brahma-like [Besnoitia besnoiti]|uniref:Putative SWI2/SNF2 Brahma-like n=1 Tax=Besnoitia besnoiti TaxID=94643 RepID=A0A2A9M639_BESBE|nr:putative SWI2/SNF2 Brahma-like [Besnoitia besnoiti]PFH31346.1 putative SWI2/SNF2 Brahma-like [Besnoitia besnoiti]